MIMNELIPAPDNELQLRAGELMAASSGTELYLIHDLSTSMRPRLRMCVPILVDRLKKIAEAGVRRLAMYVFSNHCSAWPSSEWATPQAIETLPEPTVALLMRVVSNRTALVDALRKVVAVAMSRNPAQSRVILLTDGQENESACWQSATAPEKAEIRAELARAQAAGVFVGIVGFTNKREKMELYALCEELGIPGHQVVVFEHGDDEQSVRQAYTSAGDSMTEMSTSFRPLPHG